MTASREHTIVVGLDRSDPGRAAVEYAAELAVRKHLPLRLVHADEPAQYALRPMPGRTVDIHGVLHNAAQRLVDETFEVLSLVYPTLPISVRLERGSPVEILLEESASAAVVVVGSRGSGGFTDLVIGSTPLHLASRSHCPVVAVPTPPSNEQPLHGVVVGVDGSEVSREAVVSALQAASELDEPLTAVHAWTDPARTGAGVMLPLVYDPQLVNEEERRVLAEAMAGWAEKFPEVEVTQKVVRDHPVRALVAAASGARLLVVGSHGRGSVRSTLLGSVSHGVLHHATGPVEVVRHQA